MSPDRLQTRYCVKWRATEGLLVLKITDNTTVRTAVDSMLCTLNHALAVSKIQNALVDLSESFRDAQFKPDAENAKQKGGRESSPSSSTCRQSRGHAEHYRGCCGWIKRNAKFGWSFQRRCQKEERQEKEVEEEERMAATITPGIVMRRRRDCRKSDMALCQM